jgi:uncharacterized protein YggU (UPF0235/DUF167 family)
MYIKVRVIAGAKREAFKSTKKNYFDISVKEPAQRNLANTRVRELIAGHFKVSLGKVRIVNGHHSPSKLLVVDDG